MAIPSIGSSSNIITNANSGASTPSMSQNAQHASAAAASFSATQSGDNTSSGITATLSPEARNIINTLGASLSNLNLKGVGHHGGGHSHPPKDDPTSDKLFNQLLAMVAGENTPQSSSSTNSLSNNSNLSNSLTSSSLYSSLIS